ncbi:MAG: hypothetical protein MK214_05400 [Thalassotalea sp.]|nr:hypothetical protein [Thalassotalea sp.]
MRLLVSCSITAVIAFSLGYFFSPYITSPPELPWQDKSTDKQVSQPQGDLNNPSQSVLSAHANKKDKSEDTDANGPFLADENIQSNNPDLAVQDLAQTHNIDSKVQTIDNAGQASQLTEEELVLNEWATEHRSKLQELITANSSSELSSHMFAKIQEGNDFVTQPELKQDVIDDDVWAYNMTQELRQFIENHKHAANFELLNVSCKQLMCDILGKDIGGNTWFKIYIDALTQIPNAEFPSSETESPMSLTYLDGNDNIVYAQVKFKPS